MRSYTWNACFPEDPVWVGLLSLPPGADMGLGPNRDRSAPPGYSDWLRDGHITPVRKSNQFLDLDVTTVAGKRSSPAPGGHFGKMEACAPESVTCRGSA